MIELVVALGNPGPQYERTRHNVAWMALDQLSFADHLQWKNKFNGHYSSYTVNNNKVYFLKPMTWMNLSGDSVRPLVNFFKISSEGILVIHDEVDLDLGTMNFKSIGGFAGHNGLKSIGENLGGQSFKRLRIGVSRPRRGSISDWVLSPFTQDEEVDLNIVLKVVSEAIEYCFINGFEKAASKFNKNFFLTKTSTEGQE